MENEIKNAMKFINKINEDDSIDKYNNNLKQMKNLLNTIICELNPNIKKENIQKLDSTQLWTLISSISTKYINDFKTQTKSITEIKNELNDFNNSNYLEKKRKRNNKIVKSKSKKEIENEEEENIENEELENIENEELENIENEEEENIENEEEENIENEEEENLENEEEENLENEEEENSENEEDINLENEEYGDSIYEEVGRIFNKILSETTNYISDENIYNGKYSKYQVYYYSDSSSIETISNNNKLSIVKFNDVSSIKQLNNIDENNDIIIIKIDIQVDDYPVPTVLIFALDENKNLLNIPSSSNFIVEKPIINSDYLNLERAYKLNQKSINIYNSSELFYNDICFTFSSEINGEDVTLKDRRKEYYVNITFCESTCEYSHFDYVKMKVICDCQHLSQIDDFESLSFSNLKNAFITHLINFNYFVEVQVLLMHF